MATVWTSSAAKTFYVRELGNVYSGPIDDVMSCDSIDLDVYDASNYRDDFFDPKGSASNLLVEMAGASPATGYVVKGGEAGVFTDGSLGNDGVLVKSATDAVTHIPPRQEMKTRTLLRLWTGASGTGTVLYSVWADELVSFSTAPYSFI